MIQVRPRENGRFDHILYKPYGIHPLNQLLRKFLPFKNAPVAELLSPEPKVVEPCWLDNYSIDEALMLGKVYVTTMQEDCDKLESVRDDLEQVRQVAHRIKGGAGTVGVKELMELAQVVEHSAAEGNPDIHGSINTLIAQVTQTIEQTRDWLNVHEQTDTCIDS